MCVLKVRLLAAGLALVLGFAHATFAADILIADAKSQPESLTVAPGGVLIVGSASTPFVYKVRSGSSTAKTSSRKTPMPTSFWWPVSYMSEKKKRQTEKLI